MANKGFIRRNNLTVRLDEVTNKYVEELVNRILLVPISVPHIKAVVESLEMEYNFGVVFNKVRELWQSLCDAERDYIECDGKKFSIRAEFSDNATSQYDVLATEIYKSLTSNGVVPVKEKRLLKELSGALPYYKMQLVITDCENNEECVVGIDFSIASQYIICGEQYDATAITSLGFDVDLSNAVRDLYELANSSEQYTIALPENPNCPRDYGTIFSNIETSLDTNGHLTLDVCNMALKYVAAKMYDHLDSNAMLFK